MCLVYYAEPAWINKNPTFPPTSAWTPNLFRQGTPHAPSMRHKPAGHHGVHTGVIGQTSLLRPLAEAPGPARAYLLLELVGGGGGRSLTLPPERGTSRPAATVQQKGHKAFPLTLARSKALRAGDARGRPRAAFFEK